MKDKEKVGFVAIYRKIQDHWIWDDPERFHAWVDILLSAQFHDSEKIIKGKLIKVPRGTWFISLRKLQKRWGWSRTKVDLFLSVLASEQMISTKKTTSGTFIKVLNYEIYQNPDTNKKAAEVHTEIHTKEHTEVHTEVQHTNKDNKDNKKNKKEKGFSMLRSCTWSEEEIQRYMEEVNEGKNPFGSQDVENEYFRIALDKRRERGIY